MAKWLPGFGRKQTPKTVLELMVLEGMDAGQKFTVDGDEIRIGRGKPQTGQTGVILLHDPSVSGFQATLRADRSGTLIEHNPRATNATLVNGRRVKKQRIQPGDRIQMGLVKIEVQQRQGIALSGLYQVSNDATEPLAEAPPTASPADTLGIEPEPRPAAPTVFEAVPDPVSSAAEEEATTLVEFRGRLRLLRGLPELVDEAFPIGKKSLVVGRSARCDVTVPEPGISREHLRLEWEDDQLFVLHLSRTNSTCVNRVPVRERQLLRHGDRLLLADQVEFRVELGEHGSPTATEQPTIAYQPSDFSEADTPAPQSLQQFMEEKVARDLLIEERFGQVGSFVDIDVVGSYKMKIEAQRPEHIIVSFERFRSFVGGVIEEFGGQVLNSNGDELMCFFRETHDAVRSASAILSRLDDFNRSQNVLTRPFRFRIGIHTGRSLVDLERGVAYSEVLDIAGHLQKAADVDTLFVSQATLEALPEGLPFEQAGTLPHEGIAMYRATESIE